MVLRMLTICLTWVAGLGEGVITKKENMWGGVGLDEKKKC